MRYRYIGWLLGALLLAGLLVAVRSPVPAAEASLADTWKVTLILPGQDASLYLVQLKDKDGKCAGEITATATPQFKGSKITNVRVGDDKTLHLTIDGGGTSFAIVVHPAKGEDKPKKLLGSVEFRGQRFFAQLERTDAKELDAASAIVNNPAAQDLNRAMAKQGKDRVAALKEFTDKNADSLALASVGRTLLLSSLAAADASEDELRSAAEQLVKGVPDAYGPEMKAHAELQAAKELAAKAPKLALDYAHKAEKGLAQDASPGQQAAVLKVLATALRKQGEKGEELKTVTARLDKLEAELDQEYLKGAIPFKVQPYAGRKDKSDRLVVVELFTGSQCPPCVAADVAFDAGIDTYKGNDVAFLEYHLHIPGPDPMTNKDTEARAQFYAVNSTPTVFVDGKKGPAMGGPKNVMDAGGNKFGGKVSYEKLTGSINDQLETKSQAKLELKAERDGDTITIQANAADVKKDAKDVRLRLVLVEEVVRYPGGNGQRLHHHVVRDLPGGVDGKAVEDGSAKVEAKVDLDKLRKSLEEYLASHAGFSDDSRPLDLKHLKVVALLQSNDSKEVLQSAQVDIGHDK
jgi:hypothetical protein